MLACVFQKGGEVKPNYNSVDLAEVEIPYDPQIPTQVTIIVVGVRFLISLNFDWFMYRYMYQQFTFK